MEQHQQRLGPREWSEQRWDPESGVDQQKKRWNPESGVSGTAAEVVPREWSEWNSITGGTQRVEWNSRSRGGTQRME